MAHSTDRDSARTLTRSKCTTSRHAINDLTQNGMLRFTHRLPSDLTLCNPAKNLLCNRNFEATRTKPSINITKRCTSLRNSAFWPHSYRVDEISTNVTHVLHSAPCHRILFLTDGGDRLCQLHTESEFNDKVHI